MPDAVLTRPAPAKINLGLQVLHRRPDGFHEIATVMLPIGWADELTATPAAELVFTTSDPALPIDRGNLVVRAADALGGWAGVAPSGRVHLEKRVPYGAGLGSGSSDAAHALRVYAELWGLDVPEPVFHDLAAELGSDVPFFLGTGPMLATGRGEILKPMRHPDGTPYACPFTLVVAVPAVHVSTAEAYGLVRPHSTDRPDLADAVLTNDLARWRTALVNDFEAPVLARHPGVAAAKQALLQDGAGYAALSGSGAAVFGAFESGPEAERAAERLQAMGCRVWVEPAGEPSVPPSGARPPSPDG